MGFAGVGYLRQNVRKRRGKESGEKKEGKRRERRRMKIIVKRNGEKGADIQRKEEKKNRKRKREREKERKRKREREKEIQTVAQCMSSQVLRRRGSIFFTFGLLANLHTHAYRPSSHRKRSR